MSQWYCHVNGVRYGPAGFEVLQAWAQQGRLRSQDLVWGEGMTQWAPAGSVPGLITPGLGQAPGGPAPPRAPGAGASLVTQPAPAGSGGMTPNGQLNAQARQVLSGKWGLAIGFYLLFMLALMAAGMVPMGSLLLQGPLMLGLTVFYLTIARGGQGRIGMLIEGFNNFGNALLAALLVGLFSLLWFLAFFVPVTLLGLLGWAITDNAAPALGCLVIGLAAGYVMLIVAQLSYSQVFYLLAEDAALGPLAAVRRSVRMMRGRRGKLFGLWLRYLGWSILCLLTCGIGFLFLGPYAATGLARFYDDLREPTLPQDHPAPAP